MFKACIYASTLLQLKWTESDLRYHCNALSSKCIRLSTLITKEKHSNTEKFRQLIQKVAERALNSLEIWTIGHLSAYIDANAERVFRIELDYPLIPSLIHVYEYYRLEGNSDIPVLENLCENFADLLFWNGRPQNIEDCKPSWKNRVAPSIGSKTVLISTRRQSRDPLLISVIKADFSMISEIHKRFFCNERKSTMSTFSQLKIQLERDSSSYPDLSRLSGAAKAAVINPKNTGDETSLSLHMGIVLLKDQDPKAIVNQFLSEWERIGSKTIEDCALE